MKKVNHSQFAILGLLKSGGPLSGYDIRRETAESTAHFWKESLGHLYPTLKKMLQQGLIQEVEDQHQAGQRERRCYAITAKGEEALLKWLGEPVLQTPVRQLLLLKLFFGKFTQNKILINHLNREINNLEHQLMMLKDIQEKVEQEYQSHEELEYWQITSEYGIAIMEAKLKWARISVEKLKNKER